MRRVQWQANSRNKASVRAAERIGFVNEGMHRWFRVLPEGKVGTVEEDQRREKARQEHKEQELDGVVEGMPNVSRDGRKFGPGRHTVCLAICWDDWIDGVKEKVTTMMGRA